MTAAPTEPLSLRALAYGRKPSATSVKVQPYWWDAAPRPETPGRSLPPKADVAIVGSGFTGLSAALTLLGEGRDVVVLDSGAPGYGASTRNGGQVGSGNQKFRVKRLIELRGMEKAAELLREGTRMLDYIEHLVAAEKIDCHFHRCGRFRGAMRPEHYDAMARDLDDLKRVAGVESFMVPRAEQTSEIGSDVFFGGSVLPRDASLHPALYHAGLMQRVEARGGVIIGNAGVRRISRDETGFQLETDAGPLRSRDVLVATNGYTSGLVPPLQRRIVTVRSGLIATAELPADVMARLMPKGRVYGNTNRVFYYFRGAPGENRIVWGGRAGRASGMSAYRHLARDLLGVFPDLGDIAVTHAWDGQIGYTHDELPHLGRLADGIHYAVGYCGTGVSRATYFGHKIALQIVGDPDGRTAFDDVAFPAFPAHPIAKRAVAVVETWYRFRDYTKL
ncbi:MAG TPA: FAD-binding oxidoreductase [Methyloceanibacter sp.]|nr:FAD-binding oxidoreductase [Methyloceanibacter sp.]